MYSAKIKSLYEEYGELIEFCRSNGQVSFEIFCENWQNPVKQRITPHFLTTRHSNYYEFTTKE